MRLILKLFPPTKSVIFHLNIDYYLLNQKLLFNFNTRHLIPQVKFLSYWKSIQDQKNIRLISSSMGDSVPGVTLSEFVSKINSFAPSSLASNWDNVGLLVEPATKTQIKRILLTNDLTLEVMEEALDVGANLIFSYHPPLFVPMKTITMKNWKEKIVAICLENRIAVYSPHTSFDAINGGVNDWLCNAFVDLMDVNSLKPITNSESECEYCNLVSVVHEDSKFLKCHLGKLQESGDIYLKSFSWNESKNQAAADILCNNSTLLKLTQEVNNSEDYRNNKNIISVIRQNKIPLVKCGMGRVFKLNESKSVSNIIEKIKSHIGISHLQLALAIGKNSDSTVLTIAVCAGSGQSILKSVKADLYLTGEMSHHEVLDATQKGVHVVLCNHSNSERGFLKGFSETLRRNILNDKVEVIVSVKDRDPLMTV